MRNQFPRKVMCLLVPILFTVSMTGCTPKLDGKYESAGSAMSVEFKDDKAYIGTALGQVETKYEIKDDKITLTYNGETTVLTRNSDGTLDSPVGKLTKKQ